MTRHRARHPPLSPRLLVHLPAGEWVTTEEVTKVAPPILGKNGKTHAVGVLLRRLQRQGHVRSKTDTTGTKHWQITPQGTTAALIYTGTANTRALPTTWKAQTDEHTEARPT